MNPSYCGILTAESIMLNRRRQLSPVQMKVHMDQEGRRTGISYKVLFCPLFIYNRSWGDFFFKFILGTEKQKKVLQSFIYINLSLTFQQRIDVYVGAIKFITSTHFSSVSCQLPDLDLLFRFFYFLRIFDSKCPISKHYGVNHTL